MLHLSLEDFDLEITDGRVDGHGQAEATLEGATDAEARLHGDDNVKLVFEDDEGNETAVVLTPAEVRELSADIDRLAEDEPVFE